MDVCAVGLLLMSCGAHAYRYSASASEDELAVLENRSENIKLAAAPPAETDILANTQRSDEVPPWFERTRCTAGVSHTPRPRPPPGSVDSRRADEEDAGDVSDGSDDAGDVTDDNDADSDDTGPNDIDTVDNTDPIRATTKAYDAPPSPRDLAHFLDDA